MATVIFKFQHPDLPEEDLYFLQNTYYELPETVPMDLTTFILYHDWVHENLEGLIYHWDDIMKNGTSYEGTSFKSYHDEEEKLKLYQDAFESGALQTAMTEKTNSDKIKAFFQDKNNEHNYYYSFLSEVYESSAERFRGAEYYKSRHFLFEHLLDLKHESESTNRDEDESVGMDSKETSDNFANLPSSNESNPFGYTIKDLTFDNFDQEYFLISLYYNKNYDIPLNLIPHKYRNIGFFREAAQKEIN